MIALDPLPLPSPLVLPYIGSMPDFFLSQANWVVNRPISAYNSLTCCSWATLIASTALWSSPNRLGNPFRAVAFHLLSWLGWTPYSAAIWATVFSSFRISWTTWALNSFEYRFLMSHILTYSCPFSCPVFGVHYKMIK